MKKTIAALMVGGGLSAAGAPAHSAFAQAAPLSNIAQATLAQYRDQYQHSPLCAGEEITLWTCTTKKSVFSLCSSPVATRTTGYLQYRAASGGKVTLVYPPTKIPPRGAFEYASAANGDATVSFTNAGYTYRLIDGLRGRSLLDVEAPGASAKPTEITCGANQTLQGNYTIRLMQDFGLLNEGQ